MSYERWTSIWNLIEEGDYRSAENALNEIDVDDFEYFRCSRMFFEIYARQAKIAFFESYIIDNAHKLQDRLTQIYHMLLLVRVRIQRAPAEVDRDMIKELEDEIWDIHDSRRPHVLAMLYRTYSDYHHYLEDNFFSAIQYLERAGKLYKDLGEEHELFYVWNKIGIVYRDAGDYSVAMEVFQKNIERANLLGTTRGVIISRGNLAELMLQRGELDRALREFIQVLETTRQYGDNYNSGITCIKIGYIYFLKSNFSKAVDVLEMSDEFLKEFPKQRTVSYVILARVFRAMGRFTEAEIELRLALEICDEYSYREMMASVANQLISLLIESGRSHEVGLYLNILREITESSTNQRLRALYLLSEAEVMMRGYGEKGYSKAETFLQEVISLELQDQILALEARVALVMLYLLEMAEGMKKHTVEELTAQLSALDEVIERTQFSLMGDKILLLHAKLDVLRGRYTMASEILDQLERVEGCPSDVREEITRCRQEMRDKMRDGGESFLVSRTAEEIEEAKRYVSDLSRLLGDTRAYVEDE